MLVFKGKTDKEIDFVFHDHHNKVRLQKQWKVFVFYSATSHCLWDARGGRVVLGKLPVPGRPTTRNTVGHGPTALAVGAGGGFVWTFLLSSILPFLSLPLFGRRLDID